MNQWQALYRVLYEPARVFESMRVNPQWLMALIVVTLTVVVVTAIIMKPLVLPEQLERISRNPEITPEAREQIMEHMNKPFVFWSGLIGAALGQPAALLLTALVFWALFSFLGGKGGFAQAFSAVVHGSLVSVPASIIKVPLMFALGTVKVHTSLALALPSDLEESFIYRLLSQVDIFTIWSLSLMAVGFSIYFKVRRRTSYVAAFGLWAVWILLNSALGGMFHFGPR